MSAGRYRYTGESRLTFCIRGKDTSVAPGEALDLDLDAAASIKPLIQAGVFVQCEPEPPKRAKRARQKRAPEADTQEPKPSEEGGN